MSDKIAYARHGDTAVLTVKNPPVNALSQAVRQGLWDAMDRAEADTGVRAVLIVGEGRAFFCRGRHQGVRQSTARPAPA